MIANAQYEWHKEMWRRADAAIRAAAGDDPTSELVVAARFLWAEVKDAKMRLGDAKEDAARLQEQTTRILAASIHGLDVHDDAAGWWFDVGMEWKEPKGTVGCGVGCGPFPTRQEALTAALDAFDKTMEAHR